ncbi:MAG: toxin-antitoxin system [Mycobacterium sp.]|nr:MAG: toxin-antitoxin system [Mycobacterium sp.]
MAQPHKGERTLIASRAPQPVFDAVAKAAAEHGISISAYVADVLAVHVGRPDLVRDLGHRTEELPLAM